MVEGLGRKLREDIGTCSTCANRREKGRCPNLGETKPRVGPLQSELEVCEFYEPDSEALGGVDFDEVYNVFFGPRRFVTVL